MKKNVFRILLIIILASFVIIGCSKKSEETIKIGAILPLSGNLSFVGELNKKGLELALQDIEKSKTHDNKKIEIIYGDSGGQSIASVNIMNKFINVDKIKYVISSMSPIVFKTAPIANEQKVINIGMCSSPNVGELGDYLFNFFPDTFQEVDIMVNYLAKNTSIKKVGILYVESDYGLSSQDLFREKYAPFGEVVSSESYRIGDINIKLVVSKIKDKEPDVIVLFGYGSAYPAILKAIKELKWPVKILSNYSFINPPVQRLSSDFLEGVVFTVPAFNIDTKGSYAKTYEKEYGTAPDHSSVFFYDALKILVGCINSAGDDVEKVRKCLLTVKGYKGGSGTITVKPNGTINCSMLLVQYKDNKFVPIKE